MGFTEASPVRRPSMHKIDRRKRGKKKERKKEKKLRNPRARLERGRGAEIDWGGAGLPGV